MKLLSGSLGLGSTPAASDEGDILVGLHEPIVRGRVSSIAVAGLLWLVVVLTRLFSRGPVLEGKPSTFSHGVPFARMYRTILSKVSTPWAVGIDFLFLRSVDLLVAAVIVVAVAVATLEILTVPAAVVALIAVIAVVALVAAVIITSIV